MVEVKEDMVLVLADAAAFADLHRFERDTTSRLARSFALGA